MGKEVDSDTRERLGELIMKPFKMDETCKEIWLTLIAYRSLRFNELQRSLRKLGMDLAHPILKKHLDHLVKQKLIKRKAEGVQKVSYAVPEEIWSFIHVPEEDLKRWLEAQESENLPEKLRPLQIDMSAYYEKMTEKQLDQEIDRDVKNNLALNLFELKTMIGYDLKIDKLESDSGFWKFIGNPIYRMHERRLAEKCRESNRYKDRLMEKIEEFISNLRNKPIKES